MPGIILTAALLCAMPLACLAWSGHQVTEGDLIVLVEEVPPVTALDVRVPVTVRLENTGDTAMRGEVAIRDLVDATRVVGPDRREFELPPAGETALEFAVAFGEGTYSALYPVHAHVEFRQGNEQRTAHAVRIVEVSLAAQDVTSPEPTPMEGTLVPERGALPLWTLRNHRVAWRYWDGPMQYKPAGWTGSDAVSRASMGIVTMTRGVPKASVSMHPPWVPGGGTIFADYLVKLPDTTPLKLTFANAIRDHAATEPPSDGVLFRVWAAEGIEGANPELLYENFTDAKVWAPGEADLGAYAGRTILLRLESHPGPARNTTCDSSFWGEPMVVAGEPPPPPVPFELGVDDTVNVGRRLHAGTLRPDNRYTFLYGEGDNRIAAVFRASERGLVDGVWSLVGRNSSVSFDGFDITIMDQDPVRWPTAIAFHRYSIRQENGRTVHVHHLERDGQPFELTITIWTEGDGLRIAFASSERITNFSVGAADRQAPVVYYGHGYRIVNPRAFRAGFGGHNLSTSHVGCEFEGGLALLQAVDVPPSYFEVTPESRRYALRARSNGALTLVAGERGAMDCAIRYRPLHDKQPAGGVQRLAGRFAFDIWGGRYGDIADNMAQMIRYGLTDSFLTVHNWQRWGYDYRLPDIWPPNPQYGTVEDMRRIGEVCNPHDIPWGLHDNYIDFYPDAEGYTYDHICFTPDGRPIKAWLNEGRDAQSYRWRPDRFMPFLERNLRWIKDGVAPTHYFIDVFTSIGCIDFYDREGNFHPGTETRRHWGEAFAWIRDFLGNDAPTTSEAGHDQLIGYLDGADCQFLQLSDTGGRFYIHLRSDDWQRVPWYDAVNHGRFVLFGVGYSGRYEGERPRHLHGINSDDYISAEMLLGHSLMVDAPSWGRPAVRKYWLAQQVARNLALQDIVNVEFVDGDMHRQIVTWGNGTRVYVNRGEQDWAVEDHVLPQYGYLALGPEQDAGAPRLMSAIETREEVFCESSAGPGWWYCNARAHDHDRRVLIEPRIENFRHAEERTFTWDMVWEAREPAPRDMTVFVHFYSETATRRDKIAFQDDHRPTPPTSQWRGTLRYSRTITVPEDAEGDYEVAFGIYDTAGRLPLTGREYTNNAMWVGTLSVTREDDRITDITLTPAPPAPEEPVRMNLAGDPVDFGFALTDGAFRVERTEAGLRVTPLPRSPEFSLTLRLGAFGLAGRRIETVTAVGMDDTRAPADFRQDGGEVTFRHDGATFAYEVTL